MTLLNRNFRIYIYRIVWVGIALLTREDTLHAQLRNPQKWMLGYQLKQRDTSISQLDTGVLKEFGVNIMDFSSITMSLRRYARSLSLEFLNINMYDDHDQLLFYSNGNKVFNSSHRLIENADSLNYGSDWSILDDKGSYFGCFYIGLFPESMLAFQSIKNPSQYYLVASNIDYELYTFPKLTYSILDMSLNDGKGKMIEKETIIKKGGFAETIAACRHGNGRDWWILSKEYESNCFTKLLIDSSGIHEYEKRQCIGWTYQKTAIQNSEIKSSKFSWDGKYYAILSLKGIEVFNFNRCSGELSNRREDTLPGFINTMEYNNICFSPNSQFLYITTSTMMFQYNIVKKEMLKIADYDNYTDTPNGGGFGFPTFLVYPQLAPDGKIYISTGNSTRYLHTIESPDEAGTACDVRQHSTRLLTFNQGLPNFPNYELGAENCWGASIQEERKEDIEIYPNPTRGRSYIRCSEVSNTPRMLYVYDVLGREVLKEEIDMRREVNEINTSDWAQGLYLVKVIEGSIEVYQTILQVQRNE